MTSMKYNPDFFCERFNMLHLTVLEWMFIFYPEYLREWINMQLSNQCQTYAIKNPSTLIVRSAVAVNGRYWMIQMTYIAQNY